MTIVVCVKQVPDDASDRGYTADGRVRRDADDATLNAADEDAVRVAVGLAPGAGAEVTVLTMGPPSAARALRRGLQLGAHRAVLVTDAVLAGSDVFSTATVLAAAVRRLAADGGVDLVLTGAASRDARTAVLPVLLAAELDMPCATGATEAAVTGGVVRVRRRAAGRLEVHEADGPAVVAVATAVTDDQPVTTAAIRAARAVPVVTWTVADLGLDPLTVGHPAARTRVAEVGSCPPAGRVLLVDDGTAGERLADYLITNGLVP
ncbi:electron transfer flavoprotein subunit beta [uncultured Cellulomonas sp.]|uniref:electron transfer flavoprotein subunit beta/FixA family protein n=1 Tax=uncultured Cellulomonas sp. TaxID=189682 RepID=UPI002611A7BD|nr:electron transfer flavoprotein subunit beta [uncultured Cellulomonas sp.]